MRAEAGHPLKLMLAFDSFKESMTSVQAARCFKEGFLSVQPGTLFDVAAVADGGEGFVEALAGDRGVCHEVQVVGPLGNSVTASYTVVEHTAIIELASCAGLALLTPQQRNPLLTSTYGVGQLIVAALDLGCTEIVLGLGGSATVDCGIGTAQALGVRFYDDSGELIKDGASGKDLERIAAVDHDRAHPRLKSSSLVVACDVRNPLLGDDGAAAVFGPQKGADARMVGILEKGLSRFSDVVFRHTGCDMSKIPGGGAAGGVGALLHALFEARLESGMSIILAQNNLVYRCRMCDLVVTGEGRLDGQTAGGKVISGMLDVCLEHTIPLLIVAGSIGEGADKILNAGPRIAAIGLAEAPISLAQAMQDGPELMIATGARVARLIRCFA